MRLERSDHVIQEEELRRLCAAYNSTRFTAIDEGSSVTPVIRVEFPELVETLRELAAEVRRLRNRLESIDEPYQAS